MTARLKAAGGRPHVTAAPRAASTIVPGSRTAHGDPRWPLVTAALDDVRGRKRHAVRIVDADCAGGALLIEAVRYARRIGFTAIEGHGIDGSPLLIGRARAARERLADPATGLAFELADMVQALTREADFPADIVLWHGTSAEDHRPDVAAAIAAAGDVVIGDPAAAASARRAA